MIRRLDDFLYAMKTKKWNRTLPLRILSQLKNLATDLKYSGKSLEGIIKPVEIGAYHTQSSDYAILSHCFHRVNIRSSDVLVDVGCGRGRVLQWWLNHFPNKLIGVELNGELAKSVQTRFKDDPNVTVMSGSILEHLPEDGTVFYLFNPFDASIMSPFKDRLTKLFYGKKDITLVYVHCKHIDLFKHDDHWDVHTEELKIPLEAIQYTVAYIKFKNQDGHHGGTIG